MRKLLVIDGSLRSGQTQRAIELFADMPGNLFETEVVRLKNIRLEDCRGCALCLSKGEEFCPIRDGRDELKAKMEAADCILFATPNFALHVTSLMKTFFERFSYYFHRPAYFGKVFSSLITQGAYGGGEINRYFKTTSEFWGGVFIKGPVFTLVSAAYDPTRKWDEDEEKKVRQGLKKLVARINKLLDRENRPVPSLFRLMIFRFTRSAHKYMNEDNRDHHFFKEKGWFKSDYYYPVKLGPVKRSLGLLADIIVKKMAADKKKKLKYSI